MSGRAAGDPQLQGCTCGGQRGHTCVLVFLGLCAVWLLHERRVYLSGYNSDVIPFSSPPCFFTMWLLQRAKQTNKQTHTWESKLPITTTLQMQPGLACISPVATATESQGVNQNIHSGAQHPHTGKINDSMESLVCLPYLSLPTPVQQRPSCDLSYACQTPRRSQASSIGDKGTPPLL